jgi:hypothetical protein
LFLPVIEVVIDQMNCFEKLSSLNTFFKVEVDHLSPDVPCPRRTHQSPNSLALEFNQLRKRGVFEAGDGFLNLPEYLLHDEIELMAKRLRSEGF